MGFDPAVTAGLGRGRLGWGCVIRDVGCGIISDLVSRVPYQVRRFRRSPPKSAKGRISLGLRRIRPKPYSGSASGFRYC